MRVPPAARPRRIGTALSLLLLIAAILPSVVAAETVENLAARASSANRWSMTCTPSAGQVSCTRNIRVAVWAMLIKPGTGPIDSVDTGAQPSVGLPLDSTSIAWMSDMHQFACGDPKAFDTFVGQVGALTKNAVLGPVIIGTCTVTGGLYGGNTAPQIYHVFSMQLPPPTPGPTPTAPPTATPKPTPAPTHTPHPSASPTPGASASTGPSASPSTGPSESPEASASNGPSPIVAGEQTGPPTPGPSTPIAGPGEASPAPTPAATLPTFEQSVLGITDVNTEPGAFGGSLVLALLMLLIIGFAGELFNNTVENNYTEIAGWFRKRPLGWLRELGGRLRGEARIRLLSFIVLTAIISCFVDPYFGLNLYSLAEFLGMLVGLIVVLASFKLPAMLAHRRATGDLGRLRPLPWALVIAIVFVLVSRIGNLQPGYLYAIVLGAIFVKDVDAQEEGRETLWGSVWTLTAAVLGWLGLTWLRVAGVDQSGFGAILLSTLFAAVVVSGLEATAFGLMPLRFMPGYAVYQWNRLGWALLWAISLVGFLNILINPTSGYESQLSFQGFVAALGVFAGFGALSIATWMYFRFRPSLDDAEAR